MPAVNAMPARTRLKVHRFIYMGQRRHTRFIIEATCTALSKTSHTRKRSSPTGKIHRGVPYRINGRQLSRSNSSAMRTYRNRRTSGVVLQTRQKIRHPRRSLVTELLPKRGCSCRGCSAVAQSKHRLPRQRLPNLSNDSVRPAESEMGVCVPG